MDKTVLSGFLDPNAGQSCKQKKWMALAPSTIVSFTERFHSFILWIVAAKVTQIHRQHHNTLFATLVSVECQLVVIMVWMRFVLCDPTLCLFSFLRSRVAVFRAIYLWIKNNCMTFSFLLPPLRSFSSRAIHFNEIVFLILLALWRHS